MSWGWDTWSRYSIICIFIKSYTTSIAWKLSIWLTNFAEVVFPTPGAPLNSTAFLAPESFCFLPFFLFPVSRNSSFQRAIQPESFSTCTLLDKEILYNSFSRFWYIHTYFSIYIYIYKIPKAIEEQWELTHIPATDFQLYHQEPLAYIFPSMSKYSSQLFEFYA